ncbi:transglycosylase domain-containing protein [Nocardiopsis sp. N85]|uniref:transglycosylase domain-containing protein n=1 Tax=Nocardiopsis sp. N85 TaxID=3029400 RepID=UPI00237F6EA1|nr:transglycosylase domain-containing protein [Nocardiopsis sp. N85]MDE3723444.1 transglycosylase domain-containing protein [Nocardiopsis sp. N85]
MSTERRRSADDGRRRADGPANGPGGNGGRRRAEGPPPREQRAGGRRSPDAENGFWGEEDRPRRRPPADDARPEDRGGRRRAEGERPRRPEGQGQRRRPPEDDPRRRGEGPRRRPPADGERPRRRPEDAEHGARSEGGRRRPPQDGARPGGRRRAEGGPRDPRDREHGARSEGGRRRAAAAAGGGGRGGGRGGGGRRREEGPDDRPWWKRFLSKAWKPALAVFGLMIIGGVAAFALLYAQAPDPKDLDAKEDAMRSATQIFWETGDVAVTTGEVRRIEVQYEDIPPHVIDGIIAAEQHTFFEDPAISIMGIGRALVYRGEAGGGSTITQQMARNYYSDLDGYGTIERKIREIFISIKLGQRMEKEEILERYVNTIYFGRQAMGIEMAARQYFDKSVTELDEAEAAYLGLVIQMPANFENSQLGPWTEKYLHEERWPYMQGQLAAMKEENGRGLSKEEAQALEIPPTTQWGPSAEGEESEEETEDEFDPKPGYVRDAVITELVERYGLTSEQIATKGYKVETSLNPDLMDAAYSAFDTLPGHPEDTRKGLTAINPATGEIVAFRGGSDVGVQLNQSLVERTQAGSSYKPYVLAEALKQNISLRTLMNGDSPQNFAGLESEVKNADGKSHGAVDLVESTMHSYNTPYVQLAEKVTPVKVDETAVAAGVDPEQIKTSTQGPLIALGTHQVSALDQATGYATFAAQGLHRPAHMVTKVTSKEGTEVQPNDVQEIETGTRAMSADVANDVTYALTEVVANGGGSNAALPDGRPVAGKTGTSSGAISAWFVGYVPQLSVAVGLSREDANVGLEFDGIANSDVYGGRTSATVWNAFMVQAIEIMELEPQNFPPAANVGTDQSFAPSPSPDPTPSASDSPEEPSDDPTPDVPCDPNDVDPNNPNCAGFPTEPDCERFDFECPGDDGDNDGESPGPEDCFGLPLDDPCWSGDDDGDDGNTGRPGQDQSQNGRVVILGSRDD